MKRLLPFALCLMSLTSYAREVKVTVASGGEPLGFSYVYINRKPFGSVGNNGVTFIPAQRLTPGDTISASFVGYKNDMAVYKGPRTGGYTIELLSDTTLDKISVFTDKQMRAEMRRYVERRAPLTSTGTFEANILFHGSGSDIRYEGIWAHYFKSDLEYILKGDTIPGIDVANTYNTMYLELPDTNNNLAILKEKANRKYISDTLLPLLRDAYYTASRSAVTLPEYLGESGTGIKYLGISHDQSQVCRMFLLSRTGNGKSADGVVSSQVVLGVDSVSREIFFANMEIQRRDGRLNIVAYYKTYKHFLIPIWVDAIYTLDDGRNYYMSIRCPDVSYYDRPRIFDKKSSEKIYCVDENLVDINMGRLKVDGANAAQAVKTLFSEIPTGIPVERLWEYLETIALLNSVY